LFTNPSAGKQNRMNGSHQQTMPLPRLLRLGHPPYRHGEASIGLMTITFLLAAGPAVFAGLFLFGWDTIRVTAICVTTGLIAEAGYNVLIDRSGSHSEAHALLIGLLLACTFPPQVHWSVPVTGVAAAVLIGLRLSGGIGNYLWHPVALGRVLTQIVFPAEMSPDRWPVLARGQLLTGDLSLTETLHPLSNWQTAQAPQGVQAWSMERPLDLMQVPLHGNAGESPPGILGEFVRDFLPPWSDLLTGVAGGCIGTASVAFLILGGLFLLWRGYLRAPMIVAALATIILSAAIFPVDLQVQGSDTVHYWFPVFAVCNGLPVGLAYVGYQVIAGDLLFVLLLLASDPTSSPLTSRGHAVFGFLIAATAMVLRLLIGLPAAAFWALLIANATVPIINRITRRRVLGT
jgi:electron transport complex protein RnfD